MRLEGLKIGLIEDDLIIGEALMQALELEGAHVLWWDTGAEALNNITHANRDICVCDIRLPDTNGEFIFDEASRYRSVAPFLFMTAYSDVEQAVSLLKKGAGDYLTKPFNTEDLIQRILSLVPTPELRVSKGALGPSAAMLEIESTLKRVALTRLPVLFSGEMGVGKEVCARFLHNLATKDSTPFLPMNCAAIPADSFETQLFGSERPDLHHGYAERAQDGTLFLSNVADLSLQRQPTLLRLLEEETFFRLGGLVPVHFNARVMCSTSTDLVKLGQQGQFREDLLYRINTISIRIPPLRERFDDIVWLAKQFLQDAAVFTGEDPKRLSSDAEERLLSHSWPGNVRELRNRIERATTLAKSSFVLPHNLFTQRPGDIEFDNRIAKLADVRDQAEKRQIRLALTATDGNISKAARTLGVSRTTMWEKMLKHGVRTQGDS